MSSYNHAWWFLPGQSSQASSTGSTTYNACSHLCQTCQYQEALLHIVNNIKVEQTRLDALKPCQWKKEGDHLVYYLENQALDIAKVDNSVGISKVTGGSTNIFGGVILGLGALATTMTLGIGAPLMVLGIASTIAGSTTSGGSDFTKSLIFISKMEDIQRKLEAYKQQTDSIIITLKRLNKLCQELNKYVTIIYQNKVAMGVLPTNLPKLEKEKAISSITQDIMVLGENIPIEDISTIYQITKWTINNQQLLAPGNLFHETGHSLLIDNVLSTADFNNLVDPNGILAIIKGIKDVCNGAKALQGDSKLSKKIHKLAYETQVAINTIWKDIEFTLPSINKYM